MRLESYGQIEFDPSGESLLIERRGPYRSGRAFDLNGWSWRSSSRILVKRGHGPIAPLFPQEAGAGYWLGGFSPSGRQVAIFRLRRHRLTLGIARTRGGRVRWLPGIPDLPVADPRPLWLDDRHLVVVSSTGTRWPSAILRTSQAERHITAAWRSQARGQTPSADLFTSGAFAVAAPARDELRLIDLATRRSRAIFHGPVDDLAVSADGHYLAVVVTGYPIRRDPAAAVTAVDRFVGRALVLIDLATHVSWSLAATWNVMPNLIAWSPEGHRLLIAAQAAVHAPPELLAIEPETMQVAPLLPPSLRPTIDYVQESSPVVRAAWLGAIPMVRAHSADSPRRSDWYAIRSGGPQPISGDLADGGGPLVGVEGDLFWIRDRSRIVGLRIDDTRIETVAGTTLRFQVPLVPDPFEIGARRFLNPASIRAPRPSHTSASRAAGAPSASPDCQFLPSLSTDLVAVDSPRCRAAFVQSDRLGRAALLLVDAAKHQVVIDRINQHLDGVEPARTMALRSPQPDGRIVIHWLYLPARARESRPPLVVLPYPGQVFADGSAPPVNPGAFMPGVNPELLAARGFAVLIPSIPLAYTEREPMRALVAPVLAAIDAVGGTGLADTDRVAVYGHSYGAYAALALAAQTGRFRSVIAASGVGDLYSAYGLLPPRADGSDPSELLSDIAAWHESGQGRMGGTPWSDAERYLRNSPFARLDHITAPVLLIHGDMDGVSIGESERTFAGLARLGKDAMLLRYRGEGHVLASPANISDQWRRIFAWLDRTL